MSRRTSRRSISNQREEDEEDDILAEVFAILSKGGSHWYTINGDTSSNLSLCRRLGFFSEMDYYAYLGSKGLAAYIMNKQSQMMEVYIVEEKWKGFLVSKNYGLSSQNAEHTLTKLDMKSLLRGETPSRDIQYCDNFHLICFGQQESDTRAKEI